LGSAANPGRLKDEYPENPELWVIRDESVPVKEVFNGKTIWEGIVEVFDLHGHPKANAAYAWPHATYDPAQPKRHVTVLHIPPAVSPEAAVRPAIVQEYRNLAPAQS
jgi:hypothetical protein